MIYRIRLVLLFSVVTIFSTGAQSNIPPTVKATGDQIYCPLTQMNIVTDFDIIDPDDTEIEAIFIQIAAGYNSIQDRLQLTGSHPNITSSWSSSEGKLTLRSSTGGNAKYTDLIAAVKDVTFYSSLINPTTDKFFSITVGDANYLPSTDHFYEYVEQAGISWSDARTAADNRTYFGLKGYLATITSKEEAQLAGEQAQGTGWIGASDEETEGTWKWMTGPEAGQTFWIGNQNGSTTGTDIPYENWNTGEPNNLGNEDYAHITAPGVGVNGSWNDLANGGDPSPSSDYHPKGYIVEYGGTAGDPILNISGSTSLKMAKITTLTPNSNCGAGTVTLNASSNYGDVLWFDDINSSVEIFKGNSFTTPVLNTSKTYFVLPSVNGCTTGTKTPVTATIIEPPTVVSVDEPTICAAGSVLITASTSAGSVNWYDAPIGGNLINSGSVFIINNLTKTTTYFAEAINNGCVATSRRPVTVTVQITPPPTGNSIQQFCDTDNATLNDVVVSGNNVKWYDSATDGTELTGNINIINNTTYYASQTMSGCESHNRLAVTVQIFETLNLPTTEIPAIQTCDDASDGDDTNGFSTFNLTLNESIILNGSSASDFNFHYFTDASHSVSSRVSSPSSFRNTVKDGQTIYVQIENKHLNSCKVVTEFDIVVHSLPEINNTVTLKNCDEDGIPDGFTIFNLEEVNTFLTKGDSSLNVTYYLSQNNAILGADSILPYPFNNATSNQVFARIENNNNCFRIATINLLVSTTSFPNNYLFEIEECERDNSNDGISTFNLTVADAAIISQFPSGQNLIVHYYESLEDAQLELNEIIDKSNYQNTTPDEQKLFVRVESLDNGDCFGIGEHLVLKVNRRPEFDVDENQIICLNNLPLTLFIYNSDGNYEYRWSKNGTDLSTQSSLNIREGGIYQVIARSSKGCESFTKEISVIESIIPTITLANINVSDDSSNNTITINTLNLGIGNYEFALDSADFFQDEPFFENVQPGIRTVFIRDKNGCGSAQIDVSVIGYPGFFTPNNDGYNDTWSVLGATNNFYTSALVQIFDRYGKILFEFDATKIEGWDGTFNSIQLPSTDYWFSAILTDIEGKTHYKKGHFSLIRR